MQLLLALLFALASCVDHAECTKAKVIGGWHVSIEDFPYHVQIVYRTYVARVYYYSSVCGGSIINEWWILTAAHCLVNYFKSITSNGSISHPVFPAEDIGVALARSNIDFSKQWLEHIFHRVERVIPYPNYNVIGIGKDIGLLRLHREQPLVWSRRVQPVVLPPTSYIPQLYSQACMAGTGRVSPKNRVKDKRFKANCGYIAYCTTDNENMTIKNVSSQLDEVCWLPRTNVRHSHSCSGDSGSALVKKLANKSHLIIGLNSRAGLYCTGYSSFTFVAYYIPWITSIIEEEPSKNGSGC